MFCASLFIKKHSLKDFLMILFYRFMYNDYGGREMKSKNVNMLSGSITRGLLAMAIPIMIMNVMQSVF